MAPRARQRDERSAARARTGHCGKGFERFYGFLAGETDQYQPDLVHDNHQVRPPRTPEEGYHLTEDLADHAIDYLKDLRAYDPDKPFFMYFAPGACHAPHQAPASFIEPYRGRFDQGWDAWRDAVYARQVESGLLPAGTELSERPSWVPAWESLGADERRLYARMMEVYAGFLTHTDAQVGRVLDFVDRLGETDNTIVMIMSDNGASAEGGPGGTFNELYFFNFVPESMEENLRRIDDLGTPRANNHYPWGWAWAGNTPLKRFKRDTHEGGVCDPLVISWPARLRGRRHTGGFRDQYVHAIDVLPTLLDLVGIDAPAEIDGVAQAPIHGVTLRAHARRRRRRQPVITRSTTRCSVRARCTTTAGRRSCSIRRRGWPTTAATRRRSFDDDVWELYHVADDFSECHDVAEQYPEKLAELQARVVGGGGAQSRVATQQPTGTVRRPALPARALRVPPGHLVDSGDGCAEPPQPAVPDPRDARRPGRRPVRRRDRRARRPQRRVRALHRAAAACTT